MTQTATLRKSLVPTLQQDCLKRQEIAQFYRALAKAETCAQKRDLYRALASQVELGLLRPARRLNRLGESVPAFQRTWHHRLQQWSICRLSRLRRDWVLTWLQATEQRMAQRYLEVLRTAMPPRSQRPTDTASKQSQNAQTLAAMLLPRSPYYGTQRADQIAFNAALQDFSNQVALICALETGGKLQPMEAMARLETLWQGLQMDQMRHRLSQAWAESAPGEATPEDEIR